MSLEHDAADRIEDAREALDIAATKARYGSPAEALAAIADAQNHLTSATGRLVVIHRGKTQ